jgi:hypothetical protein
MKLMMFAHGGKTRLGVVQGEEVVAVAGAGVPEDLAGVIAGKRRWRPSRRPRPAVSV